MYYTRYNIKNDLVYNAKKWGLKVDRCDGQSKWRMLNELVDIIWVLEYIK